MLFKQISCRPFITDSSCLATRALRKKGLERTSVRDFALTDFGPPKAAAGISRQNREGCLAGQEDLPRVSGRGRLNFKLAIVEAAYGLLRLWQCCSRRSEEDTA